MGDVSAELGRAFRSGAAQERPILVLLHLGPADRAGFGKVIRNRLLGTLGKVHFQNFRNDLPCLANKNRIPHPDVPLGDEILVVKGCIGHGGAGQADRLHHSLGGQNPGPSHLDHNILHHRGLDFRGIFVGNGPAGEFCRVTQGLPLGEGFHLDNRTVNVADEFFPVFIDGCHFPVNVLRRRQQFVGNHFEFQVPKEVQRGTVAGKRHAFCQLDIEDIDIQAALCGDLRVQLPQRTGSGVSGVGKERFPVFFPLGVQLLKPFFRHKHLAPDNEPGRGVGKGHGNGLDGFQVFRHVLAYAAVSPGSAPDENAVLIFQRHGKAVDFRLNGEGNLPHVRPDFLQKFVQLFHAEHIPKAHKGHRMNDLFKLAEGLSAHSLCGGIGQGKLRMGFFQLFQLPQKAVIFKVGHGWVIQDIIAVARILQKRGQRFNSLFGFH